jgi:hypothetical protein
MINIRVHSVALRVPLEERYRLLRLGSVATTGATRWLLANKLGVTQ